MERELFSIDGNRVSGVVSAIELHNVVRALTKLVSRFPLAFVAPLDAQNDYRGHVSISPRCLTMWAGILGKPSPQTPT